MIRILLPGVEASHDAADALAVAICHAHHAATHAKLGGIMSGEDAIEFIMAGATAVSIGTANFADPWACPRIIKEIEEWMQKNKIDDINKLRSQAYQSTT